jgi:hypothetical protein
MHLERTHHESLKAATALEGQVCCDASGTRIDWDPCNRHVVSISRIESTSSWEDRDLESVTNRHACHRRHQPFSAMKEEVD